MVASCDDRDSLRRAIDAEQPDVVVTDIRMPPSRPTRACRWRPRCAETHPDVGVVVLSQYADPRYGLALLDGGSDGRAYLLKERIQHRGQLVSAIETVAEGGSMIDAKVVEALIEARAARRALAARRADPPRARDPRLRRRGHSNQAIADELVLTKRAVEKHINAIFLKLGLTDARTSAAGSRRP